MKLLPVSKVRLVSDDSIILYWNGVAVIVEAFLSLVMFAFLPEFHDPFRRSLILILFVGAVVFGFGYYFTSLGKRKDLSYLPYIVLPPMVLCSMFALPSISYYFLFFFWVLSTAYAVRWAGDKIIYYFILAGASLVIFSLYFTDLVGVQKVLLAISLVISFLLFGYNHTLFAKLVYRQRKEKMQVQKLARELQSRRLRDRAIMETIKDGIVLLDPQGRIKLANRAAEKLLDRPEAELEGVNFEEFVGDSDLNYDFAVSRVSAHREGVKIGTDGEGEMFVDIWISPLVLEFKKKPAQRAYLLTMNDVTEEMELERMKLDFVAMAAHELRAPITAINGYLSVLQDELASEISPEYQKFLDRSLDSSHKLSALMENLLSITKIEKGKMAINKKPVVWREVVEDALQGFYRMAESRGLELIWEPPSKRFPQVMADPLRISEVITNLVNNALTYTKQGKVVVRCEYDEKEGVVVTQVEDTGPGIPQESLPHLFEKFYRIAGPLEEGSKGTGLGLYISKSIVDMHGGKIWVESEVGEGSTFSFSLPVS